MPQFYPSISERTNTLKNKQTSYAVWHFEDSCNVMRQKYLKNDPNELELKTSKFNESLTNF